MTQVERDEVWNFIRIMHDGYVQSFVDSKALLTLLSLKTGQTTEACEKDLEELRKSEWYQAFLKACKASLDPIEKGFREAREVELFELLRKLPTPKGLN